MHTQKEKGQQKSCWNIPHSEQLWDILDKKERETYPVTASKLFLYKEGTPKILVVTRKIKEEDLSSVCPKHNRWKGKLAFTKIGTCQKREHYKEDGQPRKPILYGNLFFIWY